MVIKKAPFDNLFMIAAVSILFSFQRLKLYRLHLKLGSSFFFKVVGSMASVGAHKDKELRIHESFDELGTDLADYIADLSETSVKERGVFAVALSGGSLIDLMGYINAFLFQV